MRKIDLIVLHCSATRADRCYTEYDLMDANGHSCDTRTAFQKHSLRVMVMLLLKEYPGSRVVGHRDLSPDLNHNGEIEPEEWIKECPCFDAATILQEPPPPNPAYL